MNIDPNKLCISCFDLIIDEEEEIKPQAPSKVLTPAKQEANRRYYLERMAEPGARERDRQRSRDYFEHHRVEVLARQRAAYQPVTYGK